MGCGEDLFVEFSCLFFFFLEEYFFGRVGDIGSHIALWKTVFNFPCFRFLILGLFLLPVVVLCCCCCCCFQL